MSDSDSDISDLNPIEGFTKGKSLYCLKAPWLETKGALGEARRILSEREDADRGDG